MEQATASVIRLHGAQETAFRDPRDLVVYLPPDYETQGDRRYPVLFLHDGQNLFDPATAFLGTDWGLSAIADELIESGEIEPVILAGIYNTGEARIAEYTPVRDRRGNGGRARLYGKLLVEEIKPFIDREYRTRSGPADTGLGGSSLGGLVTLYLGLRYPDVFGKLIIMSPSLWWANRAILRGVSKLNRKLPLKIWVDTGTCEGQDPEACLRNTRELWKALQSKGWQPGIDLAYLEEEGAGHNEKAWGNRMRHALKFLFGREGS